MENKYKTNSYLSFKLGEEIFAANVEKVLNILEMSKVTKVPHAPSYMKGVINLRGMVLPLIDTRLKFGMSETEYTHNTCILVLDIIVEGKNTQVGALTDAVQEVLEIDFNKIQPAPNIGTKYQSEFIEGVIEKDEVFIMLLDMDKVFSSDEILMLNETTKAISNIKDTELTEEETSTDKNVSDLQEIEAVNQDENNESELQEVEVEADAPQNKTQSKTKTPQKTRRKRKTTN